MVYFADIAAAKTHSNKIICGDKSGAGAAEHRP